MLWRAQIPLLFLLVLIASGESQFSLATPSEPGLLTNAASIRDLSPEEAAQHHPVRLIGVVLGIAEIGSDGYAIHDGTAGVYIQGPPEVVAKLKQGDLVEVTGITDPGEFAPFIIQHSLIVLGKTNLPEPIAVTFDEIISGKVDAQWIQVSGIVRTHGPNPLNTNTCQLEIATGGGRLTVRLNTALVKEPLIGAKIKVKGVCYYKVNKFRQVINPVLSVPPEVSLEIIEPAPEDPYSLPVQPINLLLQFAAGGSYGHMVHVTGIVTCIQPHEFWIRDNTKGLRILTPMSTQPLAPGQIVSVLGFPKNGEYSPALQDAIFRIIGSNVVLQPRYLQSAAEAFDYDADLITLEATITDLHLTRDGIAVGLKSGDHFFRAILVNTNLTVVPRSWQPESRVRITGICNVIGDPIPTLTGLWRPQSFQIIMRSPTDLTIIRPPPFLTQKRIMWILGLITLLSLTTVAVIWTRSRIRLREQLLNRAMTEAQFIAVLNERERIARELHDILAQGLNAIVLNLDLVRDEIGRLSERAAKHLQLAYELARMATADARNAVWNMRAQVLEQSDLPTAIQGILEQMTTATSITPEFTLSGNQRRLPPILENTLLRIAQEAITNAVKHAHPSQIKVTLEYEPHSIILTIEDDGHGFNPNTITRSTSGFGLRGMRDRTIQLNGKFEVDSAPGKGTHIRVTLPIPFITNSDASLYI